MLGEFLHFQLIYRAKLRPGSLVRTLDPREFMLDLVTKTCRNWNCGIVEESFKQMLIPEGSPKACRCILKLGMRIIRI